MKQLLQNLVRHVQDDIEIVLKLHPLEPAANVEQFRQMAIAHAGKISIAEKDSDIYSLIDRSLLMIGFDSAALLEAIALSKPCITITTPGMPQGMHSMFNDKNLEEAIKAVDLDNVECITGLIDKASHDPVFYEEWVNAARGQGLYLYANNYIGNCRAFIEKFITHKTAHS